MNQNVPIFNRISQEGEDFEDDELLQSKKSSGISKFLRILPCLFFLVALIFAIVIIVKYEAPNVEEAKRDYDVLSLINKLIKASPITDIQTTDISAELCDVANKYELINLQNWPGIKEGCLCKNKEDVYIECSMDICTAKKENSYKVSEIKTIEMTAWGKKSLCVKRLDAESYKYKGDTSCATGFKPCGEYCVKGTTDCEAVTKIEMVDTCAETNKEFAVGGKCIKLTKDTRFNPIVNFVAAITQDYTPTTKEYPCLEWKTRLPAKHDVNLAYPLLKIRETGCEKENEKKKYQSMFSDSTKFAAELSEIEVMEFYSNYQVGNFQTKMFDAEKRPALYKESYTSNDKATLYYLTKIPIATYNDNCLIAYTENYDDTVQVSDVLRKTYKYCNFILIFLCALGLLMCIGYLILRRKNIKKDGILIAIYIIAFIVVFICILQASLHWYWLSSRDIKDYYGNISSRSKNDCYSESRLDAPYKNITSYIYSIYKPVEPFVIVLFVWAIIFVVITLLCLVFKLGK